jgi:cytochrome P450
MEEGGKPNISDFFPILRPLDPQGSYGRMTNHMKKLCEIVDGIIEERICSRASKVDYEVCNDVLDSLLNNIGDTSSEMSRNEMVHLFMVSVIFSTINFI